MDCSPIIHLFYRSVKATDKLWDGGFGYMHPALLV